MDAVYRIVQHHTADDFVIGTGADYSVEQFVSLAFSLAGLDWNDHVRIDQRYFRPSEVDALRADASKARDLLGWQPTTSFEDLVREMVEAELEAVGISLETGMANHA
jgi:GDPmannose 4,6-dehydratase